jgi:flagellar motor protein MotB
MATKKLKQSINSANQSNVLQKRQLHIMKELNKKLCTHNAIVTQADKGKAVVIIDSTEYADKLQSFLTTNNFNTLTRDPTNKFQKLINKIMQECNSIIDKRHKIPNTKETVTTCSQSPA